MFRRRRGDASTRPPASSAWWAAAEGSGADGYLRHPAPGADLAPPLPISDPFDGRPAFAVTGVDPTDAVLGRPDPSADWAVPGVPDVAGVPGTAHLLTVAPGPPADAQPRSGWLPLLTHEERRCQDELEQIAALPGPPQQQVDTGDPWRTGPSEDPARGNARRTRVGRRLGAPSHGSAVQDTPAEGASPAPTPSGPRDEAGPGAEATTWLDPVALPDPTEAAALASAFAADYLSWDESNPARRGEVLVQYLPSDVVGSAAAAALLGWSGRGRQRSEFALSGAVRPDGDGRLIVDVRVRVTPYRPVGRSAEPASAPADELEVVGVPSAAPAPTARGWKSLDSCWVRLAVPVTREHDRLVVDTWDEQLEDGTGRSDDRSEPLRRPDDPPEPAPASAPGSASGDPAAASRPGGTR